MALLQRCCLLAHSKPYLVSSYWVSQGIFSAAGISSIAMTLTAAVMAVDAMQVAQQLQHREVVMHCDMQYCITWRTIGGYNTHSLTD